MNIITIIFISIGLAMDCFTVSIAKGIEVGNAYKWRFLLMALLFGLFQGGMPLIGYYAGVIFADFFRRYAPWIALILLAFIGGKMILESIKPNKEEKTAGLSLPTMLMLAVATSIDALATGVIFIPYPQWLWSGVGIIASGSFLFSIAGWLIGKKIGEHFRFNMELVGGIILIAIGLKIWIEGLWF